MNKKLEMSSFKRFSCIFHVSKIEKICGNNESKNPVNIHV